MRAELRVGACGALGGAFYAWLLYAKLPMAAVPFFTFDWQVIPAGAWHGAVLAATAVGAARLVADWDRALQILVAPALAWVAGMVSWIPLARAIFGESWARSLTWPFHDVWSTALLGPWQCFGLVAGLYYLLLVLGGKSERGLGVHLLAAIASAVLGSLWWWIALEFWSFNLLHAMIWALAWGSAVGAGAWAAARLASGGAPQRSRLP